MRSSVISFLACLAVVFGYAVYDYGGVISVSWDICLTAIGLIGLVYFVPSLRGDIAPPLRGALKWSVLLLLCYVAFQLLPLPVGLLRIVSPSRAELLDALSRTLPGSRFAPLSIVPAATFSHLLRLSAYTLVFLLVREMTWHLGDSAWKVALPLIVVATLEGALGVSQYLSPSGMAHGTYVNRNHYAGLLEMILPFAVMFPIGIARQVGGSRNFGGSPMVMAGAGIIAAAGIFLGLVCSLSRMGFIACVCSFLIMAGVALFRVGFFTRKKGLIVGLVMMTILLGLLFLAPEALITRFSQLENNEQSTFSRTTLWRETLPLIAAYPLFGCGLGGYESGFIKFKVSAPIYTADFAHNDYLQLLAELGLVGFGIGASLLLLILTKAVLASLRKSESQDRLLALACTGAITAILVHSFADFNLYIPANAMLLAWISGIAAGLATPRRGAIKPAGSWTTTAALSVVQHLHRFRRCIT